MLAARHADTVTRCAGLAIRPNWGDQRTDLRFDVRLALPVEFQAGFGSLKNFSIRLAISILLRQGNRITLSLDGCCVVTGGGQTGRTRIQRSPLALSSPLTLRH